MNIEGRVQNLRYHIAKLESWVAPLNTQIRECRREIDRLHREGAHECRSLGSHTWPELNENLWVDWPWQHRRDVCGRCGMVRDVTKDGRTYSR